jgi:hypothetical protein
MDMTPEERADVAPGFVPSDDVSTPLSVKVADEAVSLATPIDSIVEIQEELAKENPDYLKIGMLGGMEAIGLLAPGAGKAAQSMIRKGADMARQTDNVIDVASNVPKVAKEPFKKTRPAYKLFVKRDEKLYPLFVNASDEIPVNEWLEADFPDVAFKGKTQKGGEGWYVPTKGAKRDPDRFFLDGEEITKKEYNKLGPNSKPFATVVRGEQSKATGDRIVIPDEETRQKLIDAGFITEKTGRTKDAPYGKVTAVAARPGYHASVNPVAEHLGPQDIKVTKDEVARLLDAGVNPKAIRHRGDQYYVKRRAEDQYWAEVEMADDTSDELRSYMESQGRTDINDKVPKGGSYSYVDGQADGDTWVVGGDMKVKKVLSREEAKAAQEAAGVKDLPYRDEIEEILGRKFAEGGLAGEDMYTGQQDYLLASSSGIEMSEGGSLEKQTEAVFKSSRGYAEGGEVGAAPDTTIGVDPVSGNEVPMGATPEEVRDDIPAQLSEGEYVVPADVVRFYGVKFFEDLRTEAKQGYAEMDQNGRIGGEPVGPEGMEMIEPEDDLPFDISELQVVDEETGMYVGGLTGYAEGGEVEAAPIPQNPFSNTGSTAGYEIKEYVNDAGEVMYIQFMNGEPMTFIPQGFRPKESVAEQAATGAGVAATSAPTTASMSAPSGSGSSGGSDSSIGSTGMGDVDAAFTQGASAKDWTKASVEDFTSATSNLGRGTRLGSTIAGAINPLLGVATGIGMGSESRNNAYDMLDGIAYQLESGNLSEGQRTSLLDQQAKIQEYLKPSSKDDSPATTLLKGSGIFGGQTSMYENLGDFSNDGRATFADTWLGDLLGADGTAGVQGPSLSESLDGARRTGEPVYEGDAKKSTQASEPSKYQKQMESGNYSGAAKTATNSWVAATNAANSMKDKSGPAYHAAMKAQSDASRAATEAIRKASGWTGGFFGKATNPNWRDEDKDDDK